MRVNGREPGFNRSRRVEQTTRGRAARPIARSVNQEARTRRPTRYRATRGQATHVAGTRRRQRGRATSRTGNRPRAGGQQGPGISSKSWWTTTTDREEKKREARHAPERSGAGARCPGTRAETAPGDVPREGDAPGGRPSRRTSEGDRDHRPQPVGGGRERRGKGDRDGGSRRARPGPRYARLTGAGMSGRSEPSSTPQRSRPSRSGVAMWGLAGHAPAEPSAKRGRQV